jgi:SpoVK/Ycf46/Vps4 family AAA+-type ATPase
MGLEKYLEGKTDRQTGCTLYIFLDEIDMIAPHREASEDDSKVTELRISQILTEIDGWKM